LIAQQGKEITEIIGFFQSGCAVLLNAEIEHVKTPLKAGIYKLNSIKMDGRARVTSATGIVSEDIALSKFLDAGLRRA
jgi:hypothetical protein